MIDYNNADVVYDIETEGACTLDFLKQINSAYPSFSQDAVKCGNCRNEEEKVAKIETARLAHSEQERAHWQSKLDKAALSAETGRIVTIGYLPVSKPEESAVLDDANFDEAELLRRFWKGYYKVMRSGGRFVGWNSNGFDLPYIAKRSWILGLPVPPTIYRGKWISDTFLDLMQVWAVYEFRKFAKLDHCARILGIGNKSDQECCGAEFATWYRDPILHNKAVSYGLLDLQLTREIYLRLSQPVGTKNSNGNIHHKTRGAIYSRSD